MDDKNQNPAPQQSIQPVTPSAPVNSTSTSASVPQTGNVNTGQVPLPPVPSTPSQITNQSSTVSNQPTVVTAQPFVAEPSSKKLPLKSIVLPLSMLLVVLLICVGGFLFYQHAKKVISSSPGNASIAKSNDTKTKTSPQNAETNPGGISTVSWTNYSDAASKISFRLPGPLIKNNPNIPIDGLTAVTYEADYQGRTVASVVVISDPQNKTTINEQSILDFEAAKYNNRLGLSADSHNTKSFDVTAQSPTTVQNKSAYKVTGQTMFDDANAEDGILIDEFSAEIINFGQYKVIAEVHGTNAEPSVADPVRDAIATTLKL